jgi:hypothetical protein
VVATSREICYDGGHSLLDGTGSGTKKEPKGNRPNALQLPGEEVKTLVATPCWYSNLDAARDLLESARYFGIDVKLIGFGQPYKSNFYAKLHDFIPEVKKFTGYDRMMLLDCSDTLFAASLSEINAQFEKIGKPFVMATECNAWPTTFKANFNSGRRWCYPNTGFWMADWGAFIQVTDALMQSRAWQNPKYRGGNDLDFGSDQGLWAEAIANKEVDVWLDESCRLCQCMVGVNEHWSTLNPEFLWQKRPRNLIENTYPCVFHFNGGSYNMKGGIKDLIYA